jgi:hypothetical protein
MRYTKPIQLRYTACIQLDDEQDVGIGFDYLHDAISFCKRSVDDGDWYEVIDNKTKNVVAAGTKGCK